MSIFTNLDTLKFQLRDYQFHIAQLLSIHEGARTAKDFAAFSQCMSAALDCSIELLTELRRLHAESLKGQYGG